MRRSLSSVLATVGALVIAAVACGGSPASGVPQQTPTVASTAASPVTNSPDSPSPSPKGSPLALESCGELTHYQDGNVGPVLCPDGRPSLAADTWFRSLLPQVAVLRLEPNANLDDVETAICADKTFGHMTNPMVESAYHLKTAEEGWQFGDAPMTWLMKQAC